VWQKPPLLVDVGVADWVQAKNGRDVFGVEAYRLR
jgi:hypothetical protein